MRTQRARTLGAALVVASGLAAVAGSTAGPASAEPWSDPTSITVDLGHELSTLQVSGMQGVVADVRVTLWEVGSTHPDDIDILLRSPGGRRVVLMSDACLGEPFGPPLFGTVRIDDAAVDILPDDGPCSDGKYRPTDHVGNPANDGWVLGTPNGVTMAAFDGGSPNGTWTLEVRDDASADPTNIYGGWTLDIDTVPAGTCQGLPVTVDLGAGGVPTNGSDVIVGTAGNDAIDALGGHDTICGLDGADVIQGGGGDDRIDGGAGRDAASYAAAQQPVRVTLGTVNPQDTGASTGTDAIKRVEDLYGGPGGDLLAGGSDHNRLVGRDGDDRLVGRAGNDSLIGGLGADSCDGGADKDSAATCEGVLNVP